MFCFVKIYHFIFDYNTHSFLRYNRTKRTLRGIHFIKWSWKYLNWKVEIYEINYFHGSLYNLIAKIGSIKQDIIQYYIFIKQKSSYSFANEKMFCKFVKIMRRFCFYCFLSGWFSTPVKYEKYGIWGLFYRFLNEGSTELIENGFQGRG